MRRHQRRGTLAVLGVDCFHAAESFVVSGATHDTSQKRNSEVKVGRSRSRRIPSPLLSQNYEGTLEVSLADGALVLANRHPAAAATT